jgi:hypothetical protein
VRQLVVAAFRQVHFIADPLASPLATVAHIAVVGRAQPLLYWRAVPAV